MARSSVLRPVAPRDRRLPGTRPGPKAAGAQRPAVKRLYLIDLLAFPLSCSPVSLTSSLRDREMEVSCPFVVCIVPGPVPARGLCPRPAWTSGPPQQRPSTVFSFPANSAPSIKHQAYAGARMERSGSTERRDSIGSSDGTGGDGKGGAGGGVSGEKHQRSVSPTLCLSFSRDS